MPDFDPQSSPQSSQQPAAPWEPFLFPRNTHSIYNDIVHAVSYWETVHNGNASALAELDAWLPILAKMEIEQVFERLKVEQH